MEKGKAGECISVQIHSRDIDDVIGLARKLGFKQEGPVRRAPGRNRGQRFHQDNVIAKFVRDDGQA
jgi:hypothetical protein